MASYGYIISCILDILTVSDMNVIVAHEAGLSPLAYSCGNDRRSDLTCPMSILAAETDRYFGKLVTYGSD